MLQLSWPGYDFLDQARDADVWQGIKRAAGKLRTRSLQTLAAIARQIILRKREVLNISSII